MLSRDQPVLDGAEADLARRDPDLPALPLLLEDTVLSTWLSDRLGRPVRARRRYLRYKPGTSCVAAVGLEPDAPGAPGARSVMVAHWTESARAKMTKTCERAAPGSVLAVDETARVVVGSHAADRDLPALVRLADPERAGATLRRVTGSHFPDSATGTATTLSYKPQRRWVGSVTASDGRRVLLRAYRPRALGAHLRAARSLGDHAATLPQLLGQQRGLGLAAFAWVEGHQLDWRADLARAAQVARALAALHRHPASLPAQDASSRGEGVLATAALAATLLPDLAGRLDDVARTAVARLREHGAPEHPVTLHGDFSADQVVLGEDDARLIDLDRARSGDRADDLASLAATLWLDGLDPDPVLAAVLEPYERSTGERIDPAGLTVLTAVQVLERCTDGFRLARPDWVARLHRAVTLAEELLS